MRSEKCPANEKFLRKVCAEWNTVPDEDIAMFKEIFKLNGQKARPLNTIQAEAVLTSHRPPGLPDRIRPVCRCDCDRADFVMVYVPGSKEIRLWSEDMLYVWSA